MVDGEAISGAGALALRLAAALFLTAACLFALVAFGIMRLETETVDGAIRYVLPGGSGRSLDPTVVSVFTVCACVTGLLGAAVSVLGHGQPIALRRVSGAGRRPYLVLAAGLLLLVAALIVRFSR